MSERSALLVAGTSAGCGKTIACTGLAGVMRELGIRTEAIKPLDFSPESAVPTVSDQQYMDAILRPMQSIESITAPSPHELDNIQWSRVLAACQKLLWPGFIECPGTVGTPWKFLDNEMLDVAAVSRMMDIPVLLVARKSPDLIGEMGPALSYLKGRNATIAGWLGVEVQPTSAPYWELETRLLFEWYHAPYLGEIPYSPSISVPAMQQGNLLRTVENGVDLLPIQQALRMPVM